VPLCAEAGVEYTEFQVGVDALTVVVNPENDWATCLTIEQLNKMWEPAAEGKIDNWNQIDPSFPDQALALAGPGTDSGTFDYFTDEINGEEGASRSDYTASEDDNVTVQAVAGDPGALGYLGFTYFEENMDSLKAVEIDGGRYAPGGGRHAGDGDREKLNVATILGWRVLRFSTQQVEREPERVVEVIVLAYDGETRLPDWLGRSRR